MESDGDHFLAYYLTKEDEPAIQFKEERLARDPNAPEEEEVRRLWFRNKNTVLNFFPRQPTNFHFVRDYEVVKVEQEVPNEFLLVLNDGDDGEDVKDEFGDSKPSTSRAKGAYYKNIERKMLLKKRRVNVSLLIIISSPGARVRR